MQVDETLAHSRKDISGTSAKLLAGAAAGLSVDLSLYPLDTVKTRLQSGLSFAGAGGFRALYSGVPSVMIGSAPGSALFFASYEYFKHYFRPSKSGSVTGLKVGHHLSHLGAASLAEIVACFVRVPTEIIKQRAQAFPSLQPGTIFRNLLASEGVMGLYRGFGATILREIPFSAIELPIWEFLKHEWAQKRGRPTSPLQSALCGSLAGAIAAAVTTPLDVIKTRIMLCQKLHSDDFRLRNIVADIWKTRGLRGLYAGVLPRTVWMALGGLIFFGAYDATLKLYIYAFTTRDFSNSSSDPSVRRTSRIFLFDYIFVDFVYELFYNTFNKSRPKLETFDDVYRLAMEVKNERLERLAKQKAAESNKVLDNSGNDSSAESP